MCWTKKGLLPPVKHIADKDIKVFKIVLNTLQPYYYQWKMRYQLGLTSYSSMDTPKYKDKEYQIYVGLHSYDVNLVPIDKSYKNNYITPTYNASIGLGSIPLGCMTYVILYCTIPKGASYYLNEQGEYVSDRIRPYAKYPVCNLREGMNLVLDFEPHQ